ALTLEVALETALALAVRGGGLALLPRDQAGRRRRRPQLQLPVLLRPPAQDLGPGHEAVRVAPEAAVAGAAALGPGQAAAPAVGAAKQAQALNDDGLAVDQLAGLVDIEDLALGALVRAPGAPAGGAAR